MFLKAVHFSFFSVFQIYWIRALHVFWISGLREVKSDPNLPLIFRMLPINSPVTCSHHDSEQLGYVTLLCHMYPEWSCTQVFIECSRRGVARQSGMSEMFPFHWERKLHYSGINSFGHTDIRRELHVWPHHTYAWCCQTSAILLTQVRAGRFVSSFWKQQWHKNMYFGNRGRVHLKVVF